MSALPPARPEVVRRVMLVAGALCALVTVYHLARQLPDAARLPVGRTGRDLEVYYDAARDTLHRRSPYRDPGAWSLALPGRDRRVPRVPGTYLYPPTFAVAIAPLGLLPPLAFYRTWFALVEIALWAFCGALVWVAHKPRREEHRGLLPRVAPAALLVGPLACSPLLIVSFLFGQADLFVFALAALAFAAALAGRPVAAGAAVAAAASIKLYPVLLLLPLWRRFGWRPVVAAALVTLFGAGSAALWLGPGCFVDFARRAAPVISQGTLHAENTSLAVLVARAAIGLGWLDPAQPAPLWCRGVTLGFAALFAGLAAVAAFRRPFSLAFGWAAGLGVLMGAICWTSYWSIFLILAAALWRERNQDAIGPGAAAAGFAVFSGSLLLVSLLLFDGFSAKGPLTILLLLAAVATGAPGARPWWRSRPAGG